jgi:hypothetical protein
MRSMSQPGYPPYGEGPPQYGPPPGQPYPPYQGYQGPPPHGYPIPPPPPLPGRPANVIISAVFSFLYAVWLAVGALVLFVALSQTSNDSSGTTDTDVLNRAQTLITVLVIFNILLIVGYLLAGIWTLTRTRLVLYVCTGLSTILSVYWFARFNTSNFFVFETVYLLFPYVAVILAALPNATPFYAARQARRG